METTPERSREMAETRTRGEEGGADGPMRMEG